jgi:hypothetical protein
MRRYSIDPAGVGSSRPTRHVTAWWPGIAIITVFVVITQAGCAPVRPHALRTQPTTSTRPTSSNCPSDSPEPVDSATPSDPNPQLPRFTPPDTWPVAAGVPGTVVTLTGRGLLVTSSDGHSREVPLPGRCDNSLHVDPAGSPDARSVAWLGEPYVGPYLGLDIAATDGSRTIGVDVAPDPFCGSPVWSPDGRQLVIPARNAAGIHPVEVVNADGTRLHIVDAQGGCSPIWSANGRTLAYLDTGDDTIVTIKPDGSDRVVSVVRAPTGTPITELRSVSPAGVSVVVLESNNGSCGDSAGQFKHTLVPCGDLYLANLTTGALRPLTNPDGAVRNALFGADGSMALQIDVVVKHTYQTKYVFWTPDGEVAATATIPMSGVGMQTYTPVG